jgi:hypothetical protein
MQKSFPLESNPQALVQEDSQATWLNMPPILTSPSITTQNLNHLDESSGVKDSGCIFDESPTYSIPATQQLLATCFDLSFYHYSLE